MPVGRRAGPCSGNLRAAQSVSVILFYQALFRRLGCRGAPSCLPLLRSRQLPLFTVLIKFKRGRRAGRGPQAKPCGELVRAGTRRRGHTRRSASPSPLSSSTQKAPLPSSNRGPLPPTTGETARPHTQAPTERLVHGRTWGRWPLPHQFSEAVDWDSLVSTPN